jgi:hypothetical protein
MVAWINPTDPLPADDRHLREFDRRQEADDIEREDVALRRMPEPDPDPYGWGANYEADEYERWRDEIGGSR